MAPRRGVKVLLSLSVLGATTAAPLGGGAVLGGLVSPWPYACQAPLQLGQPCEEDGDCVPPQVVKQGDSASTKTGHHCHALLRVCSEPLPRGAPCATGLACAEGLGCRARAPEPTVCHVVRCRGEGDCVQGPATGQSCVSDKDCPDHQVCNVAEDPGPSLSSGVCWDLPTQAGQACSDFIGSPYCGAGLSCLIGSAVCDVAGQRGQSCPMPPDRCGEGLTCFNNPEPPFNTTCLPGRPLGSSCFMGGECQAGAYCDNHDLSCRAVVGAGSRCRNGNECGESPLDDGSGMDCVRGFCVDTSVEGAACWPHTVPSRCTHGRVCRTKEGVAPKSSRSARRQQEVTVDPV